MVLHAIRGALSLPAHSNVVIACQDLKTPFTCSGFEAGLFSLPQNVGEFEADLRPIFLKRLIWVGDHKAGVAA